MVVLINRMMMNNYCLYYQAQAAKPHHLFLVGLLKYYDHLCFDRTLDAEKGIFEFFVPQEQEPQFLEVMAFMEEKGLVHSLVKSENRLT
jgi:hypothetical protein